MTSGVTTSIDSSYGWDWSSTTHKPGSGSDDTCVSLAQELVHALGGHTVLPGKGLQGWDRSLMVFDRDGFKVGSVFVGGREDVHVQSTGAEADTSRWAVLGIGGARTARVDTRVDTLMKFEELALVLEGAAESYGSRIGYVEYKERGESLGRTIYLGAPSSAVRVRVYEKWLESPGQFVEGTNRVEVQLRPASRVKDRVTAWGPAETFCASKVTRDLAVRLGDEFAPKASLHIDRGTPDLEQSLRAMGDQYGGVVDRWLQVSGGDLGRVVAYLTGHEQTPF